MLPCSLTAFILGTLRVSFLPYSGQDKSESWSIFMRMGNRLLGRVAKNLWPSLFTTHIKVMEIEMNDCLDMLLVQLSEMSYT